MSPLRSASDALACERRHRSGTQWQHQGSCRRDASGRLRLRLAARLRCPMDRHPGPPWCPAMPELRPQFLASSRRTPGWGPARRRTPTDPQARDRAALERAVGRDLTRTRHRQNRQSSRSAPTLIFRKRVQPAPTKPTKPHLGQVCRFCRCPFGLFEIVALTLRSQPAPHDLRSPVREACPLRARGARTEPDLVCGFKNGDRRAKQAHPSYARQPLGSSAFGARRRTPVRCRSASNRHPPP